MTYLVPGMSCAPCKRAVDSALTASSGVEGVRVDLATKLVTVGGDLLDDAEPRGAIARAGYEAASA